MRVFLIIAAVAVFLSGALYFYPEYLRNRSTMLRLNSFSPGKLPRNFRMTHLKASGSSQFSEAELKNVLQTIPYEKVVIVDLREEPHAYLNGDAISWYTFTNLLNEGKTREEIIADENERMEELSKRFFTVLYYKKGNFPHIYRVREVLSSKDLITRNGAEYLHLPVSDHKRPNDEVVDEFITIVKNLKEDVWLHFHCSAGKGRTTTFLAMYDIILHSQEKSLEEIVSRHVFYGGKDILSEPEEDNWKAIHAENRTSFIKDFYQYAMENPDFSVTWSEWVRKKQQSDT